MATVHCDIVSANESLFSGLVEMVVATGSLGEWYQCWPCTSAE